MPYSGVHGSTMSAVGDPRLPTPVRLDGDPATGRQWRACLAEFHRLGFGALWQASTRYITARLLGVPYIDHWTYVTGRQAERLAATLSGCADIDDLRKALEAADAARARLAVKMPKARRGQRPAPPIETDAGRVGRWLA
jgi:hypothetical protein